MPVTVAELAKRFGLQCEGGADRRINGVASLAAASPEQLAFYADGKRRAELGNTRAGVVILCAQDAAGYPGAKLISANPHADFARIAAFLTSESPPAPGAHETAVIDARAEIGANVAIGAQCVIEAGARLAAGSVLGPGCYIGAGAAIGARSRLIANVTVLHGCSIGADCILHPGAVIGSDGFGYAREGAQWIKVPQLGRVVIGERVEIGANSTIDRGALEDTVIGDGVKIDNQVQVAHNVRIGEHTAIAGCVGIAGSTSIGRRCTLGGAAVILGHLEIADDVHVTAGSLVTRSLRMAGTYSSSMPVEPVERWHRNAGRFRQLEAMHRRIKALEDKIESLTKEPRS